MYFPGREYPFTRVYEPKNRSAAMAPERQTSLLVEVPCQPGDAIWQAEPDEVIAQIQPHLVQAGFFTPEQVIDTTLHRIHHAYPILTRNYRENLEPVRDYLNQFENLHLTGRNGLFAYSHIHDHMRNGRQLIRSLLAEEASVPI